ncbi:threonine/serine dehydratase [Catelliglobosispora koreensis]|uniref:threonine/serine dehydratase n=1 Tax=Catelliglobosispora koreensis TaxID=129052 RepID=UPI000361F119|nr:threonine/serine dehydratase [Catelliglobosispora koreensis]
MITAHEVTVAAQRIKGWARHTPLFEVDRQLAFKLEYLQVSGSFKARGAFNRLLAAKERGELDATAGAVSASGGNAALAVAYAGVKLGVPVTVFVPETAPAVKVAKLKALGANVNQAGSEYAAAFEAAQTYVAETGALFCHAYDQPEVVAGAGTVGAELIGHADTVLTSVGGGGLIAGVAAALEGHANVIGAEPENCPTLHTALSQAAPVDVSVSGVAADSLGARRVGQIAFEVVTRTKTPSLLVSDEEIIAARRSLWEDYRIVVEHGAAAAYAAYRGAKFDGRVVVILCGANTSLADF